VARSELWPHLKSIETPYFDHEAFHLDVAEQSGFASLRTQAAHCGMSKVSYWRLFASLRTQAAHCGMSKVSYWRLIRGKRDIRLEEYLVTCALLQRPMGSWLNCVYDDPE